MVKRRRLIVMKKMKEARLQADGKNTAQEPRQLEDQENEEDDADLMGQTRGAGRQGIKYLEKPTTLR